MTNGPTLPPQAYTREFLTSAFNWLQTQPESVKKMATTPDALVGLFRRAQRFGNSSLENDAPVSSQNFMTDLKSLAVGLKEFEGPKESIREPVREITKERRSAPAPVSTERTPTTTETRPTEVLSAVNQTPPQAVNSRSLQMIQEVKTAMNLSSDTEALNMMVALAYKNLKNLLA